jgi:beta-galactosidase/beta-glucuronidase
MKRSLVSALVGLSVAFASPLALAAPAGPRTADVAAAAPVVEVGGRYGNWRRDWRHERKAYRRHRHERWKHRKHLRRHYSYRHHDRRYRRGHYPPPPRYGYGYGYRGKWYKDRDDYNYGPAVVGGVALGTFLFLNALEGY